MAFQTVFKRYELKYMITREQQAKILKAMAPYMVPDQFGKSTVRNIYFDTDDHILARHSIAKPDFKEKLRIRSYTRAKPESAVFIELKRKFDHIVYKRRVALPESIAMGWTLGFSYGRFAGKTSGLTDDCRTGSAITDQMAREIEYFLSYYGDLRPVAFISYDRQAFRMRPCSDSLNAFGLKDPGSDPKVNPCDADFRVTFDENILFRDYDLSLESEVYGEPLLEEGKVLMELKCSGGIPLWMTKVLSEEHVYKTSFSKYGTAYIRCIQPEKQKVYAAANYTGSQNTYAAANSTGSQNIYAAARVTEPHRNRTLRKAAAI